MPPSGPPKEKSTPQTMPPSDPPKVQKHTGEVEGITREDLEQFKQDIFRYIDLKFDELMSKINN